MQQGRRATQDQEEAHQVGRPRLRRPVRQGQTALRDAGRRGVERLGQGELTIGLQPPQQERPQGDEADDVGGVAVEVEVVHEEEPRNAVPALLGLEPVHAHVGHALLQGGHARLHATLVIGTHNSNSSSNNNNNNNNSNDNNNYSNSSNRLYYTIL